MAANFVGEYSEELLEAYPNEQIAFDNMNTTHAECGQSLTHSDVYFNPPHFRKIGKQGFQIKGLPLGRKYSFAKDECKTKNREALPHRHQQGDSVHRFTSGREPGH